jgi:hypothetical protein
MSASVYGPAPSGRKLSTKRAGNAARARPALSHGSGSARSTPDDNNEVGGWTVHSITTLSSRARRVASVAERASSESWRASRHRSHTGGIRGLLASDTAICYTTFRRTRFIPTQHDTSAPSLEDATRLVTMAAVHSAH